MKTIEERKTILENELNRQLKNGWSLESKTETRCQLLTDRRLDTRIIIILLILLIIPGILYIIITLTQKTSKVFFQVYEDGQIVYFEVNEDGQIVEKVGMEMVYYDYKDPKGHVSKIDRQTLEDELKSDFVQGNYKISPLGEDRWVYGRKFVQMGNDAFEEVESEPDPVIEFLKRPYLILVVILGLLGLWEILTFMGWGSRLGPGLTGRILHDIAFVTGVPGLILIIVYSVGYLLLAIGVSTAVTNKGKKSTSWAPNIKVFALLIFFFLVAFGMLNIRSSNRELISRSINSEYEYRKIPIARDVLIPGTNRYSTRTLGSAIQEAKSDNFWYRMADDRLFYPSFWKALLIRK